jgi:hypothetical protein
MRSPTAMEFSLPLYGIYTGRRSIRREGEGVTQYAVIIILIVLLQ